MIFGIVVTQNHPVTDYAVTFFGFLLPLVVVICYYGGEFIDHLKNIERSLENIEKSIESIDSHLDGIEERMNDMYDDKITDISDCLEEIKYNTMSSSTTGKGVEKNPESSDNS